MPMRHLTSDGKQLCEICSFPTRGKPHPNAKVYHMECLMAQQEKNKQDRLKANPT